jgi:hypothetical protein
MAHAKQWWSENEEDKMPKEKTMPRTDRNTGNTPCKETKKKAKCGIILPTSRLQVRHPSINDQENLKSTGSV